MPDLIFIALTIIFFLLALAYVRGCEKLREGGDAHES
jgi:succinate-acetate transporter protein